MGLHKAARGGTSFPRCQWSVEQVEHAQATGKFQAGRGASKARPPGVRASSRHVHLAVALISLPCTSSTQAAARERQEGRRALGWESLVATSEGGNTAAKLAGAYLDK